MTTNSRPGFTAQSPIPFDATLSRDLLDHMKVQMPQLEEDDQAMLRTVAQGHGKIYAAGSAFKELFGHPSDLLDRAIDASESAVSCHMSMGPSVMVWALNQDWAKTSNFDRDVMVDAWTQDCLGSRGSSSTVLASCLFMVQLLPLVPDIPQDMRAPFLSEILNKVYSFPTPWKYPQHTELSAYYLTLAHQLSMFCGPLSDVDSERNPLHALWCNKATLTITEAVDPQAVATWLARSSLPLKDRQDALEWSSADVWALPCVANVLRPTLPPDEISRFARLPWRTSTHDGAAINKALLQAYCPQSYPLIELAATPEEWTDQQAISAWMHRSKTPTDVLPLPNAIFDTSPTA